MRPLCFSRFVTAALAALLFSYVIGLGGGPTGLQTMLSDEEYERSGLHKLSDEEQEVLFGLLCLPHPDFLVETAMRKMEANRWRAVDIIAYGVKTKETGTPEKYLILAWNGELWPFDLPLSGSTPEPGRYWAKTDSHVWTLLHPDGSTDNLWPLSDP